MKTYFAERNIVQIISCIVVVVKARLLEREKKTEGKKIIIA